MPAREDEIGGLWRRDGSNGEFLSGRLTIDGKSVEVVVFPNTYKQDGERTPDWRVYLSQPRPDAGQPQNRPSGPPQGGYRADRPSGRQVSAAMAAQSPVRPSGGGRPPAGTRGPHGGLDEDIPF